MDLTGMEKVETKDKPTRVDLLGLIKAKIIEQQGGGYRYIFKDLNTFLISSLDLIDK